MTGTFLALAAWCFVSESQDWCRDMLLVIVWPTGAQAMASNPRELLMSRVAHIVPCRMRCDVM